eukprot:3694561-Amphidinium_carterae.1
MVLFCGGSPCCTSYPWLMLFSWQRVHFYYSNWKNEKPGPCTTNGHRNKERSNLSAFSSLSKGLCSWNGIIVP